MSESSNAGKIIEGKYRLERMLGSGGMGSVWLATQMMVERHVAVKLLHPAFIDSDDLQARFEVEAKAIGRLNHPNCITLFDFGYSDELSAFYTVIEYIEGIPLDKRLGQQLPIDEVVDITRQVAMALDHAHHQGILHRDLKPENIMLAKMTDGTEMIKVLDFGIARLAKGDGAPDADRITKAGEVFGTPAYMSPEQARSNRQLTPSSDLYALGVMMFELTDGRLPFFSKSAFDLLMMHVTQPVPELERRDVPPQLEDLIYSLLQKDPEARPQSGREVTELLDQIETEAKETPESPRPAPSDNSPRPTLMDPPNEAVDRESSSSDRISVSDDEDELTTFETTVPNRKFGIVALFAVVMISILLVGLLLYNVGSNGSDSSAAADEANNRAGDAVTNLESEKPDERPEDTAAAEPEADAEEEFVQADKDAGSPDAGIEDQEQTRVVSPATKTTKPDPAPSRVTTPVRKKPTRKPEPKSKPEPEPKSKPEPEPEPNPVFPSISTSDEEDRVEMPSVDL